MRFLSCLLAAIVGLAITYPLAARPPVPEDLELARALRTNGMADLASEYLDKLVADKPDARVMALIGLERARTQVDLADEAEEEADRTALLAKARAGFEAFLKANPDDPLVPQANFEMARLLAVQARQQLAKARRTANPDDKKAEFAKAGPLFGNASSRLKAAAELLEKKIPDVADPAVKREMTRSKQQAELEQAVLKIDQALTNDDVRSAGKVLPGSVEQFEKVANEYDKQLIGLIARAWMAKCHLAMEDFNEAGKAVTAVLGETAPYAEPARRLVQFFDLQLKLKTGKTAKEESAVLLGAEAWLQRYPRAVNTFEGQGVRYLLASLLLQSARKQVFKGKDGNLVIPNTARQQLLRAEAYFRGLAESDNEYSDRAARNRQRIILMTAGNRAGEDISKLVTFEECYLVAQVELAKFNEYAAKLKGEGDDDDAKPEPKEDPKPAPKGKQPVKPTPKAAPKEKDKEPEPAPKEDKPEEGMSDPAELIQKEKIKRYNRVVELLTRGLSLVRPEELAKRDVQRDVRNARFLLAYSYIVTKNYYPAAILSEHLARTYASNARGLLAAANALSAYSAIVAEDKKAGVDNADLAADQKRLRDIGLLMEQSWPNDPLTDGARRQLAALYNGEQNFAEAARVLSRVPPTSSQVNEARLEQGIAAFNLARSKATDQVKTELRAKAIADLEKLAEPVAGTPEAAVRAYVLARMQLGYLYMQAGQKFDEVEKIGATLIEKLPSMGALGNDDKAEFALLATALKLYGTQGRAFNEVKAGKHEEAAALLDPVVDGKPPEGDSVGAERVKLVRREVLLLALRSAVQDGKIPRAQEILAKIRDESKGEPPTQSLLQVLRELQGQISEMKRRDNKAQIEKTVKSCTAFLDELAKQAATPDMQIYIAQGYISMDKFDKAAELLKKLPRPKTPEPVPTKGPDGKLITPEVPPDWKNYRAAQLMMARAYRMAKQMKEAEAVLKEIVGTPTKKGWGADVLDVRKEEVFLMEDQGQYKAALERWQSLSKAFQKFPAKPTNARESRVRETYYEFYFYMLRTAYKSYGLIKDQETKKQRVVGLAKRITDFEETTPDLGGPTARDLFIDLLTSDPILKEAYIKNGGKLFEDDAAPAVAAPKGSGG